MLQAFDRRHPCKASSNDDNPCLDGAFWQVRVIFWPQEVRREITHTLDKQSQARAIEDPTDQCRQEQAHSLRRPLWWLTRQEGKQDNTDPSPEHDTTGSRPHGTLCICLGSRTKGRSIAYAHENAQKETCELIRKREHQDDAAEKDRKSTRLNSSHQIISYAVFCLKKKKQFDIDNPQKATSGTTT